MKIFSALIVAIAAVFASGASICDKYTEALLGNITASNQATLLTLIVNTVVIGNYTQPNVGLAVPGILAPGMYHGKPVNFIGYFNGMWATTNVNNIPSRVNFLDGGGAAPLLMNMPADDDDSNQYFLLTHLYQFFGTLLGCSAQGGDEFPSYQGDESMFEVHKYMGLKDHEVGYFIKQVGLAAASFGVTDDDVVAVVSTLSNVFGYKCQPPTYAASPNPATQSVCFDDSCPTNKHTDCSMYGYENTYLVGDVLKAIHHI